MVEFLARIKAGAIGERFTTSEVKQGECASFGYEAWEALPGDCGDAAIHVKLDTSRTIIATELYQQWAHEEELRAREVEKVGKEAEQRQYDWYCAKYQSMLEGGQWISSSNPV